jgi:hypothetical protein
MVISFTAYVVISVEFVIALAVYVLLSYKKK